jgi:hypothetical protein
MRILVLATAPRQPDNHLLWEGLREFADVEIHYFSKQEQKSLDAVLSRFDFSLYDRVVCDLLFRYLVRQRRVLSRISGLLIYEEDACQEFIESSKWKGAFSTFYRKLPNARIVLTGFQVCRKFQEMGVDAHFLPKGFDSSKLYNMGLERDIPLGFVGRLDSDTYKQRREFLQRAEKEFGLQILRAEPGDEYRKLLNRIKVFVSADIGLGEYMAKNFEAMACGCVVLAFEQGNGEEDALGLKSGQNVILYDGQIKFDIFISRLLLDESLAASIANAGQFLAEQSFDYAAQSRFFFELLQLPFLNVARRLSLLRRLALFKLWPRS